MVGALADWFAVTALFRRPLGCRSRTRRSSRPARTQLGAGPRRLRRRPTSCPSRSSATGCGRSGSPAPGRRLAGRPGPRRAGSPTRRPPRCAAPSSVLRDDDVRAVLEQALLPRLLAAPVGPPLGRLLDPGGRGPGARRGGRSWRSTRSNRWLAENEDVVVDAVARQAPAWSPRFVDGAVALRVYRELVRVAGEVQRRPRAPAAPVGGPVPGPARPTTCSTTWRRSHRAEQLKAGCWRTPRCGRAVGDLARRVRAAAAGGGRRPGRRAAPAGDRRRWRRSAAGWPPTTGCGPRSTAGWRTRPRYVVTTYRDELTATITDTVDRWDGEETARKVELAVGPGPAVHPDQRHRGRRAWPGSASTR